MVDEINELTDQREDDVNTSEWKEKGEPSADNSAPSQKLWQRSLKQLVCTRTWINDTIRYWMTCLSWPNTNKRDQTTVPVGEIHEILDEFHRTEPRAGLRKMLFSSARRRNRGHVDSQSRRLDSVVHSFREIEYDAALWLSDETNTSALHTFHHSNVLAHPAIAQSVIDVLQEEADLSMNIVEEHGKLIVKHPSMRDKLNDELLDVNVLHPATRSFSSSGHLVEHDLDKGMSWVPGYMLCGMWLIITPLFWTNISGSGLRNATLKDKLLRKMRRFKIYLGSVLNEAHTMCWHIGGYVDAHVKWMFGWLLKPTVSWDETRTFNTFGDVVTYLDGWKNSEINRTAFCSSKRTRLGSITSMIWWISEFMSTNATLMYQNTPGSINMIAEMSRRTRDRYLKYPEHDVLFNGPGDAAEYWQKFMQNATIRVIHVAVDSKKFGSDVRIQGDGYSNSSDQLNIFPIVSGEFVGKTSAGDRVLSGQKHFGRRLVALRGSEAAWKCALGVNVRSRLVEDRGIDVEYDLGNGTLTLGHDGKYMICDDHVISAVSKAWINHIHYEEYNLEKWNRKMKAQGLPLIPDQVMMQIIDERDYHQGKHMTIPVLAYTRVDRIIKDLRVRTIGQYDTRTVLFNDAQLTEVGQYRNPLPIIRNKKKHSSLTIRYRFKEPSTAWDDVKRQRIAHVRSARYARKGITAEELRQAQVETIDTLDD